MTTVPAKAPVTAWMRITTCLITVAFVLMSCSGGDTTSSGGPTEFAGVYNGTATAAGVSTPIRITITMDGFVIIEAIGGIVCAGDLPSSIGLDGRNFSSTTNETCIVGGFPCPVNTSISGSVNDETITGSGQVLLGCPGAPTQPIIFTFIARQE